MGLVLASSLGRLGGGEGLVHTVRPRAEISGTSYTLRIFVCISLRHPRLELAILSQSTVHTLIQASLHEVYHKVPHAWSFY